MLDAEEEEEELPGVVKVFLGKCDAFTESLSLLSGCHKLSYKTKEEVLGGWYADEQ